MNSCDALARCAMPHMLAQGAGVFVITGSVHAGSCVGMIPNDNTAYQAVPRAVCSNLR